jgi:fructose-1,6-bisphosphatase/inositol monophosphatase family enzyme
VRIKKDSSLVTDSDLASEKIIIDRIKKYFPSDHIFSEESGASSNKRPEGQTIWVIDPLDGTTNFANGYPFFCVSIGRADSDKTCIDLFCSCLYIIFILVGSIYKLISDVLLLRQSNMFCVVGIFV